ncbi:hypothetical protein BJX99DRAFT_248905 [Aspergillus californicus]
MPSKPRIAIIGAGPAGLTLGLLLHNQNIPFTIYERRQKPTAEELAKPSGMLDLHDESGLAAIQACGIYDNFLKLTGECSEDQVVANIDGNVIYTDNGGLSERPEISRHALTGLLGAYLPEGSVRWGVKLLSASFSRTTTAANTGTDLVVGADGAWSRLRNLLTSTKPLYTGIQCLTTTITNITARHPHLASLVGNGSFSALGQNHGIMSQRGPLDSARIYTFLSIPDEQFPTTSGLDRCTAIEAKGRLLTDDTLLGRFGEKLKEIISVSVPCDAEPGDHTGALLEIKPLYALPAGSSWTHSPNVTLVGDAAHLMPPWAGEGVNLAMWDSLNLARVIIAAYQSTTGTEPDSFLSVLDQALQSFKADIVARAKEKAEETEKNGKMLFGDNAAVAFRDFFLTAYGHTEA